MYRKHVDRQLADKSRSRAFFLASSEKALEKRLLAERQVTDSRKW